MLPAIGDLSGQKVVVAAAPRMTCSYGKVTVLFS